MNHYIMLAVWGRIHASSEDGGRMPTPWGELPEKVGRVDDRMITRDDYIDFAECSTPPEALQQVRSPDAAKSLMAEIGNKLANQLLLATGAERDGFPADEEGALDSAKSWIEGLSEEEGRQFNNLLEAQGLDREGFIQKAMASPYCRRQGAIDRWAHETVGKDVTVSNKSVKKYYDSLADVIRVQQILIVPRESSESGRAEALAKAEAALKRIRDGEDYDVVSRQVSDCSNVNKPLSGDLGEFGRGQMVRAFEEAAFALSEGEVSDPVETPFGIHLIKLVSQRKQELPPFDEVKDQLLAQLQENRIGDKVTARLDELRADVTVEFDGL
ncbi:MAG: peptidylprolyl isomerase [Planctomycetota bacterium]|jgi:peptidyl-prolyl cis-trans isomerase C